MFRLSSTPIFSESGVKLYYECGYYCVELPFGNDWDYGYYWDLKDAYYSFRHYVRLYKNHGGEYYVD